MKVGSKLGFAEIVGDIVGCCDIVGGSDTVGFADGLSEPVVDGLNVGEIDGTLEG